MCVRDACPGMALGSLDSSVSRLRLMLSIGLLNKRAETGRLFSKSSMMEGSATVVLITPRVAQYFQPRLAPLGLESVKVIVLVAATTPSLSVCTTTVLYCSPLLKARSPMALLLL